MSREIITVVQTTLWRAFPQDFGSYRDAKKFVLGKENVLNVNGETLKQQPRLWHLSQISDCGCRCKRFPKPQLTSLVRLLPFKADENAVKNAIFVCLPVYPAEPSTLRLPLPWIQTHFLTRFIGWLIDKDYPKKLSQTMVPILYEQKKS